MIIFCFGQFITFKGKKTLLVNADFKENIYYMIDAKAKEMTKYHFNCDTIAIYHGCQQAGQLSGLENPDEEMKVVSAKNVRRKS